MKSTMELNEFKIIQPGFTSVKLGGEDLMVVPFASLDIEHVTPPRPVTYIATSFSLEMQQKPEGVERLLEQVRRSNKETIISGKTIDGEMREIARSKDLQFKPLPLIPSNRKARKHWRGWLRPLEGYRMFGSIEPI